MNPADETAQALAQLRAARERYEATKAAHEAAREAAVNALVAALNAGATPTEVTRDSGFTHAHVRKLAREHDIAPAPPGIKRNRGGKTAKAAPAKSPAMRTGK
jgi:hypothetical protein